MYRTLAAHPEYTPAFAGALSNLAGHFGGFGWWEEALAAAQESLDLRRALAAAHPDAFTPDLASTLNNMITCLSELDRRKEALVIAQEAVALRRALAKTRPQAFTPALAMTLGALGRLQQDSNAPQNALNSFREALSLLSPYFLALPSAHARLIIALRRDYISCAAAVGIDPELAILSPIADELQYFEPKEHGNGD